MADGSGLDFWQWWERAVAEAIAHHVAVYELEYLATGLGLSRLELKLRHRQPAAEVTQLLAALWQRRITERVPVQYLLGWCGWRDLHLRVTPDVLIPRPETELIVDWVAGLIDPYAPGLWVDLGTGTGAIALGLARACTNLEIHAVDISAAALAVAQENISAHGLQHRITLHRGNWFAPLEPWRGRIAGMVANPPYIPTAVVPTLAPEVHQHEPHLALDGGIDGLAAIRHLIAAGQTMLRPGGHWLVEHMAGQADTVRILLAEAGYGAIRSYRDWAGIERFTGAQTSADPQRSVR